MNEPQRNEEAVYQWCKGEGRFSPMGKSMARIYVGLYYDHLPLLSLNDFRQLFDPVRFHWAMSLISGYRDRAVKVSKERASEIAQLYKLLPGQSDESVPPAPAVTPAATSGVVPAASRQPAPPRQLAPARIDPAQHKPVSEPLRPQQPQAIDSAELERHAQLASVHGVIARWWEEEQQRSRGGLKSVTESAMDSASWAILGHLRTFNRPYIDHLKRYAAAGWSEANLATSLRRYYEQMAARERERWPVELRTLVDCTLVEVDWEAIVRAM
ncbi:MAG TPA: hypothetical protein VNN09_01090 [Candidatus Competibacteraceae bacterium]|nr:hypothetical protein [Candidatus Competibacteraceae bacterium]